MVDPTNLEELFNLCPDITDINLNLISKGDEKYIKNLLKFKELSNLNFLERTIDPFLPTLIDYFESLGENKLEKITFQFENQEKIYEFYKILFDKTNLTEFTLSTTLKEKESLLIFNWLKENKSVKTFTLDESFYCESYFNANMKNIDLILSSLETNTTLENLKLKNFIIEYKSSDSLLFLEKTKTLRSFKFKNVRFTDQENILCDSLLKNNSISSLSFLDSNYNGSFEFLKNSNWKTFNFFKTENFKFKRMKYQDQINFLSNFIESLKLNHSITSLGFSHFFSQKDLTIAYNLVEILSVKETIENLNWIVFPDLNDEKLEFDIDPLMKNSCLKILKTDFSPNVSNETIEELTLQDRIEGYKSDFLEEIFRFSSLKILHLVDILLEMKDINCIASKLKENHSIHTLTINSNFSFIYNKILFYLKIQKQ
jgi:hypothetical protein